MDNLLAQLIQLYIFAIFARIVLSWFPISPGRSDGDDLQLPVHDHRAGARTRSGA